MRHGIQNPLDEFLITDRQYATNSSTDRWDYWSEELLDYEHSLSHPSDNILKILLKQDSLLNISESWEETFKIKSQEFKDHAIELIPLDLDVIENWELREWDEDYADKDDGSVLGGDQIAFFEDPKEEDFYDNEEDRLSQQQSTTFSEIYYEVLGGVDQYTIAAKVNFVETTFQNALDKRSEDLLLATNNLCTVLKDVIEKA